MSKRVPSRSEKRSQTSDAAACACTGVRWCRRCLDPALRRTRGLDEPLPLPSSLASRDAGVLAAPARASVPDPAARGLHSFDLARQRAPSRADLRGVRVYEELFDEAEARSLLARIDRMPFTPAQSGKQKQHFGPRIDFSRQRLRTDPFAGLPDYAREIEARVRARVAHDRRGDPEEVAACRRALAAYETTDAFVLRYQEDEASNLDFHCDDAFGYGEAILDLSLESDGALVFGRIPGEGEADDDLERARAIAGIPAARRLAAHPQACFVRVPLPARSVVVLYGEARWRWQHAVLARDVRGRRTSVTLRTLSPALRETPAGRLVLERARRPCDDETLVEALRRPESPPTSTAEARSEGC